MTYFTNKIIAAIIANIALAFPVVVGAVDFGTPPVQTALNIPELLNRILFIVWPVFIGFAIITFIVAGFLFLKAQGDPTDTKLAQKAVLWGVVGLIVGILSFSIPFIVRNLIGL